MGFLEEKNPSLNWGNKRLNDLTSPIWYYGEVIAVEDISYDQFGSFKGPWDSGNIRVRIESLDRDIEVEDQLKDPLNGGLPWCRPLLPRFLNVIPKVGELVKVILFDSKNPRLGREYIGPVIPQQRPTDYMKSIGAKTQVMYDTSSGYFGSWTTDPASSDGIWRIYPNKEDIAISGRRNSDIILRYKDSFDEIVLRTGQIDPKSLNEAQNGASTKLKLNQKPAYISINFTTPQYGTTENKSTINLVADNLNLISHTGSKKKGPVLPGIIKGDDVKRQINIEKNQLHPLVYGDVLWEFLDLLQKWIIDHIHEGSKLPPDMQESKIKLMEWFAQNMGTSTPERRLQNDFGDDCLFLSKGVKTN